MALRTSNQQRVEVRDGTSSPLTAAPITVAAFDAMVALDQVCFMGDAGGFGRRDRGLDIEFAGDDTAGTSLTISIWAVVRVDGEDASTVDSYRLRKLGSVVAVLGTQTGLASTILPATMRLADELTYTVAAYGTMCRSKGNAQNLTCEPGDNIAAVLSLGDVNNALGVIFDCTAGLDSGQTACAMCEVGT